MGGTEGDNAALVLAAGVAVLVKVEDGSVGGLGVGAAAGRGVEVASKKVLHNLGKVLLPELKCQKSASKDTIRI